MNARVQGCEPRECVNKALSQVSSASSKQKRKYAESIFKMDCAKRRHRFVEGTSHDYIGCTDRELEMLAYLATLLVMRGIKIQCSYLHVTHYIRFMASFSKPAKVMSSYHWGRHCGSCMSTLNSSVAKVSECACTI